jgi:serine phosphatase RsbU (regulator of sigma subunit)
LQPSEHDTLAAAASTNDQLAESVVRRQDSVPPGQAAHEAFAELYRRHASRLLAFLAARVQRSDLDEAHQGVWLRVWELLPGQARGDDFSAWLYQTTRHYLSDRGRKQRALAVAQDPDFADDQAPPGEVLAEQERWAAPAAVPAAVISGPLPWSRADTFLREIEDHLRLVQENTQDGDGPTRLLLERLPATLEALRQVHEELGRRVAERTAELSAANAGLEKQITESARAQRRLAAEHAVARILAESSELTAAAPKILQTISHSLGWDVGVLWVLDREQEVLRCLEVWHTPRIAIAAFEQFSRQGSLPRGVGLPGRVWARNRPVWVRDLTRDAASREAPLAAREGLHAAVGFPIRNGVEFLGVMEFLSREIRQPDQELLQMMTSIGSHISQFMERMKAEKALFLREAEVGIAKKIQQGLVPKAPPVLAGFEIAGASYPAVETGGDYFDFFPLLDSCQGVAIADASGHGLGPALLVTETRAYLRAFALTDEDIGRIVARVNRCLSEDVGAGNFVTLLLARLDPDTLSLFYTSAGHTPGFLFDALGRVKTRLESTGIPLGIATDGDFPLAPTIALQSGDLVLLITDGVVEACAPDGTAFGYQRAIDLVRLYHRDTAAQIALNLYHGVRAFSHNLSQEDDITVVIIKVREVA